MRFAKNTRIFKILVFEDRKYAPDYAYFLNARIRRHEIRVFEENTRIRRKCAYSKQMRVLEENTRIRRKYACCKKIRISCLRTCVRRKYAYSNECMRFFNTGSYMWIQRQKKRILKQKMFVTSEAEKIFWFLILNGNGHFP